MKMSICRVRYGHVAGDIAGSVAAIAAALIIVNTGWVLIDPILSVLVAGLIAIGGWRVVKRSGHILLEGTPDGVDVDVIAADLVENVPGVESVHHIHIWTLTGQDRMATLHAHVAVDEDEQARAPDFIRERLRAHHHIAHVTLETDPPGIDHAQMDCPGQSAASSS